MIKYGANIDILDGDRELVKSNIINVLGLNVYAPTRVKAPAYALNPKALIIFDSFFEPYIMQGCQFNKERGWQIYPKCLYNIVMLMKNKYGNPKMGILKKV